MNLLRRREMLGQRQPARSCPKIDEAKRLKGDRALRYIIQGPNNPLIILFSLMNFIRAVPEMGHGIHHSGASESEHCWRYARPFFLLFAGANAFANERTMPIN